MLVFVLISGNPPRLAMLTAGCQCLKYFSFENEINVVIDELAGPVKRIPQQGPRDKFKKLHNYIKHLDGLQKQI